MDDLLTRMNDAVTYVDKRMYGISIIMKSCIFHF